MSIGGGYSVCTIQGTVSALSEGYIISCVVATTCHLLEDTDAKTHL